MNLQMALLSSARERPYNLMDWGAFRKYYSESDTFLTDMTVLENNYPKDILGLYCIRYSLGL